MDNCIPERAWQTPATAAIGVATVSGHHGEILQGAIQTSTQTLKRFLVTLPWEGSRSHAQFVAMPHQLLYVQPLWKTKSLQAARLTLAYLGMNEMGGKLDVQTNVQTELGFGTSSTDVVASIRAVALAFGKNLSATEIAAIAVKAETACDPCMYAGQNLIFCQREGVVMERFTQKLPSAFVVGFNANKQQSGVSTLNHPLPEYETKDLQAFKHLLEQLRIAVATRNTLQLGQVATASACINQRFLPKPYFMELLKIKSQVGACGLQVAHSGNVAGFLFKANASQFNNKYQNVQAALSAVGIDTQEMTQFLL